MTSFLQSYELLSEARSNETGATVIHFWAANNIKDKLEQAKEENVDLNVRDFYGNVPLHYAVSTSSYDTANFLLELSRGKPVANYQGISPAHIAAAKGDFKMLACLLVSPNLLSAVTPNQWGILHYASYFGHLKAVRFILQKVFKQINMVSYFSENSDAFGVKNVKSYATPLDLAKINGHTDVVEFLESNCALPTLHASVLADYKQAIHRIVIENDSLEELNKPSAYRNFTPLHFAAVTGNFSACNYLIQKGASTEVIDSFGLCPLELSVISGSTATLRILSLISSKKNRSCAIGMAAALKIDPILYQLLDYPFDEEAKMSNGDTTLIRLIKSGFFEAAIKVANKMENVAEPAANGSTALHYAATIANADLIKCLASKIPLDITDNLGRTPMTYAILADNKLFFSLVTVPQELWLKPDVFGISPWLYATILELNGAFDPSLVNCSVERFDVDVRGFIESTHDSEVIYSLPDMSKLSTASHSTSFPSISLKGAKRAAATNSMQMFSKIGDGKISKCSIIHLLIIFESRSGIINNYLKSTPELLNAPDGDGVTPIMLAARLNRKGIAVYFTKVKIEDPRYKLDMSLQDKNGMTFFHYVNTISVLEEIKLSGKDVIIMQTCESVDGRLPLHFAVTAKDPQLVTYMLRQFADCTNELKHADKKGLTPIDYAYQCNDQETEDVLISFGSKNRLVEAIIANDIELVKFLLDTGLPINSQDNNSMTALNYAAMNSYVDIEKLLLDRGADPSIQASNGYLPLHFAAKRNDKEMCCLYLFTKNPLAKIGYENQPYKLTTDKELATILFKWWKRSVYIQAIGNFLEINKQISEQGKEYLKHFKSLTEGNFHIKIGDVVEKTFDSIYFVSNIISKMIHGESRADNARPLTHLFSAITTVNIEDYIEEVNKLAQQIINISTKAKNPKFCNGQIISIIMYPFSWLESLLQFIENFRDLSVSVIDSKPKLERLIKKLEDKFSHCKELFGDTIEEFNKCVISLQKSKITDIKLNSFVSVCCPARFVHCQIYPMTYFNPELPKLLNDFFGYSEIITRTIPFTRNEMIWMKVFDGNLLINSFRGNSYFMCPISLMNIRFSGNGSGITFNTPVGSFAVSVDPTKVMSLLLINELSFCKHVHSPIGLSCQQTNKNKLFNCFVALFTGSERHVELRNMIVFAGDKESCYDICLQQVKDQYSVSPQMFTVIAKELTNDDNDIIIID